MQKYEEIKQFSQEQFRRLTGVKKSTFAVMVSVLVEAEKNRYRRAGRKSSLTMEDRLLMALE